MMKLTIVESPYSGDVRANIKYAKEACLNCIERGENPFASHLFYTEFLDDDNEADRETGISLGYEWGIAAHFVSKAQINPASVLVAFYVDRGWSKGMEAAFAFYTARGMACEIRRLNDTISVPVES